jgi:hypothetical protein
MLGAGVFCRATGAQPCVWRAWQVTAMGLSRQGVTTCHAVGKPPSTWRPANPRPKRNEPTQRTSRSARWLTSVVHLDRSACVARMQWCGCNLQAQGLQGLESQRAIRCKQRRFVAGRVGGNAMKRKALAGRHDGPGLRLSKLPRAPGQHLCLRAMQSILVPAGLLHDTST